MPSDPATDSASKSPAITGRCYCGQSRLAAASWPERLSYCHCSDCRRATGAPVAAFAAFPEGQAHWSPAGRAVSAAPGGRRWFCAGCGSPLAATFDYLPGQVHVPLGVIDQAAELPPQLQTHVESGLPWLHIEDDAPRHAASGRASLQTCG
ncbi:GFA family protein [Pseudoroseicyclus sp. CXY001]|uniref:GFA family protein n=1 Tax=Pseudoroseicyclus sp. CXY001 TaxID=3242492 RepID=UPI0035716C86